MTTNICTVPIRISKNSREIDPTEDERQGIVQNITKQAYWHVSSCKPGMCLSNNCSSRQMRSFLSALECTLLKV
jgi:hypothetical protein